jgi:hypothetical protein
VISHPTADFATSAERRDIEEAAAVANAGGVSYRVRTREQIAYLMAGTQLVRPGLVPMLDWRIELADITGAEPIHYWVGVGRTPG